MANKPFMTAQVVVPSLHEVKRDLGVDEQGEVQMFVTRDIFERLIPYLPLKHGTLRRNARISGTSHIVVSMPYARAQFFGVTRSGEPFDYEPTGPKVGSHWDRRMVADEGKAIVADANRFVRRMGKR